MKTCAILFSLVIFSACCFAQQVIFSEDFESFTGYNIYGWPQEHNQNAIPWETGLTYLIGTTCFDPPGNSTKIAGVTDTYHGQQTICMWTHIDSNVLLSTPDIDFSNVAGAFLKYDSYFLKTLMNGEEETATVEVTEDSGQTWTVLQDVPANAPQEFSSYYLDLSAYDHVNSLRIGFRYQDKGQHMTGWMIDNIEIFIPYHKDLALNYVTPKEKLKSYYATGAAITHYGQVFNNGLDTVYSFDAIYQRDNGAIRIASISGVQIPPFTSYNFMHPVPDTVNNPGATSLNMWVNLPDDENILNDTAHTNLYGTYFTPQKKLVIEEGTGTFSPWGPRGIVYMNQASQDYPDICQISVHGGGGDPMGLPDYSDYLFYLHWNYIPYFLFDRRQNVEPDSFFSYLEQQGDYFGFADIRLEGGIGYDQVEVQAHVKPAIDMQGDFRLALVITEDDVTGTESSYDQINNYAGGSRGPMGGFENMSNPVSAADMHYNFVARQAYPAPDGAAGVLPSNMIHDTEYSYTLTAAIDPSWDRTKLKAHVLLICYDDSTILNSNTLPFYLAANGPSQPTIDAGLYPNPARESSTLYFNLAKPEHMGWSIMDLSGRILIQGAAQTYSIGRTEIKIPTSRLSTGIYLVNLISGPEKNVFKMEVLR